MNPQLDVVTLGESMIVLSPALGDNLQTATLLRKGIGGCEGNVSIGLARLGHQVGWISRVGNDALGRFLINIMRGEGVDISQVEIDPHRTTGIYFKDPFGYGPDRVAYYRHNSAASALTPEDVEISSSGARYLFISGITPALSESCRQSIYFAVRSAKDTGMRVVFDPNLRPSLWPSIEVMREELALLASAADIVVPGLGEGQVLTGYSTPADITEYYLQAGASLVVVKLGEEGAYYQTLESSGRVAGYRVRQVDEVGAGDAFAAGLLSGLLDNLEVSEAVKRACALGAIAVTGPGDYEALPTRAQLEAFLRL